MGISLFMRRPSAHTSSLMKKSQIHFIPFVYLSCVVVASLEITLLLSFISVWYMVSKSAETPRHCIMIVLLMAKNYRHNFGSLLILKSWMGSLDSLKPPWKYCNFCSYGATRMQECKGHQTPSLLFQETTKIERSIKYALPVSHQP